MKLSFEEISLSLDEESLRYTILTGKTKWETEETFSPYFVLRKKEPCSAEEKKGFADAERVQGESDRVYFKEAKERKHELVKSGVGEGIRSSYSGFSLPDFYNENGHGHTLSSDKDKTVSGEEKKTEFSFETFVWVEYSTKQVYFEWIPLTEAPLNCVEQVLFPGPFSFKKESKDWYTILPKEQGILIPNTWDTNFKQDGFNGRFGTASAYLPIFGQVKDGEGYLAESLTPWNMGYEAVHEAGTNESTVQFRIEPSLGQMAYRRIMRYLFSSDCDYNSLLKQYRALAREEGKLKTLKEKEVSTPSVKKLIGAAFVHKGIKTCVQPDSEFFDKAAPDKNNRVVPFKKRTEEMKAFKAEGVKKLYLHLDGWGDAGYDNKHPDVGPACAEAGGWEGMRELSKTMEELGYLFGIHDQYRDFYKRAESYDDDFACQSADGSIFTHARWAGGPQAYLCTSQAPFYVRRNFERLLAEGVHLDGAYLDVFTCNEGDECANPRHKMSRRDSYAYRNACFRYLLSKNILPSSEEVNDWAVPWLVFCHYAPYDFMMREPGSPKYGIPIPMFNLVYHDCLIIPWMMEKLPEEDYMLYALLNGGAAYLVRDPAYMGIDGAFTVEEEMPWKTHLERVRTVSDFHEKVGEAELVRHEILDEKGYRQSSHFANGYSVEVNLKEGTYRIFSKE